MAKCMYCGEPLFFIQGKGWRHQDGELIRVKLRPTIRHPEGELVDDHVATPVRDDKEVKA